MTICASALPYVIPREGHVVIDPDSEIITATAVTAGVAGDAVAAETLLGDVLPAPTTGSCEPSGSPLALCLPTRLTCAVSTDGHGTRNRP